MKRILKTAVVTGFISAGVLVGGATSHAADLDGQFVSNDQLTLSSNESTVLGLQLGSSNQANLTVDATNNSNQSTTTTPKASVKNDTKLSAKGHLEANLDQSALKGIPSATFNTNMANNKKASGSGGARLNWNNQIVSAGGYYISANRQTSRLAVETPMATNQSSHAVVLNEKSPTNTPTSVNMSGANEQNADISPNAGIQSNIKQNSDMTMSANQNTSSQFDLLATFMQAFNLGGK